jgi:gliding motility-associated-like protein
MKNTTPFFIYSLLLFIIINVNAQGEKNIWHFGASVGLDFNSGSPVAINGFVESNEGTSSISDASGNFLFSTDGTYVYDRLGNIMPGSSTGMLGNSSSTTSALIIPNPCSSKQYYIFCVAAQVGYNDLGLSLFGGLSYSIIDMTSRSGLGDIISLNNLLIPQTAEKICAIKHRNGRDIWIISHEWNSNHFYAYLITPTGISAPIITSIGSIYQNHPGFINNESSIGYMTASPDGKKIASAISYVPNNNIELFDFDNSTGYLSNYDSIHTEGSAYGLSFSPNNKLIYASFNPAFSNNPLQTNYGVFQWDITASNIDSTRYQVDTNEASAAIMIGPDDKIYVAVANNNYLDMINFPNITGPTCNVCLSCVSLLNICYYGLPTMISSKYIYNTNPIYFDSIFVCDDSLEIKLDSIHYDVLWSNGTSGNRIIIRNSGEYWVRASDSCHIYFDTFYVRFNTRNNMIEDTILLCNDSLSTTIHLPNNLYNILWSTGATTNTVFLNIPGQYWVRVQDSCGIYYDTFILALIINEPLNIGNDTIICLGSQVNLHSNRSYDTYQWSTGSTSPNITTMSEGIYILTVTNTNGCIYIDSIHISHSNSPIFDLGKDSSICNGDSVIFQIPNIFPHILWQDLSTNAQYSITNQGKYKVMLVDSFGCKQFDSIQINFLFTPIDLLGADVLKCETTIANFEITSIYSDILWSDGSTLHNHDIFNPGTYYVNLRDTNGCKFKDTITLTNRPEPIINLESDTAKCFYNLIKLTVHDVPASSTIIWQDGITTSTIRNITSPAIYVASYFDEYGCLGRDTQIVSNFPINNLSLPTILYKCIDTEIVLVAPANFATYNWNTGQHSASISVSDTGWLVLQATDSFNCIYSDSTLVKNKIFKNPILGSNQTLCEGESIILSPGLYEKYVWNTGDSVSTLNISTGGYYAVSVSDGCTDTTIGVQINFVICEDRIAIPSAFSPNGDGVNDFFFPHFDFFYKLEDFTIYNRWGEKVYSSIDTPWDGRYKGMEQGNDAFVYQVVLRNTYKNEKVIKNGTITLIK